ncbi:quinone oxidoreductase family protein [Prauserella cavernicola]|uniref:Zinc-binding alcohol dehydrogenase family protein n=1 Tax=Prauserella cavernicola TaxID=2800127 RepID=A0A934V7S2_9PSEU|nr:zinc-binding alcohol dehydrogenase family protein [Prauserella cavernicola]MBK1787989.1 zinc-binding alcohol dehydrogenase family protein [Prauserella cavernicola]
MKVLLCDEKTGERSPAHWAGSATHTLRGLPLRFGLAEVADTAFDAAADHNREYVLVRVLGFSLNYRDLSLLMGEQSGVLHDRSRGIGSDFVGEVVATGHAVPGLEIGDRVIPNMVWPPRPADAVSAGVLTNNASRELQRIHHSRLVPVPDAVSTANAAAFSVGAQTAYAMVRRARITHGSTVLVTAATSATSLFTISAAGNRGATVYGVSRSARGHDRLRELGVRRVFDSSSAEDLKDLSGLARASRGFDAVIDPYFDSYLVTGMRLLGFGGRYVTCRLMGGPNERPELDLPAAEAMRMFTSMVAKNASIHGQCLGERSDLERALTDHADGGLDVVLDSVHTGGQLESFIHRSFSADRLGKVVYLFGDQGGKP